MPEESKSSSSAESAANWPAVYAGVVIFTVLVIALLGFFSYYFSS